MAKEVKPTGPDTKKRKRVYIPEWEDFEKDSLDLYHKNPYNNRYTIKYRHHDQELILKMTDDKKCIKFKTDATSTSKKIEKFNTTLFKLMSSKKEGKDRLDSTSQPMTDEPTSSSSSSTIPSKTKTKRKSSKKI